MTRSLLLAVVVLLAGAPAALAEEGGDAPVSDADIEKARQLYEKGNTHYDLAEYDQAIAAFKEAYKLSKRPALLYNIAQAYRQKGDCAQAAQFYKNYLRLEANAPNRAKVEERIAEMEACAKAAVPPPPPPEKEPVEKEGQGGEEQADVPPIEPPPPINEDRPPPPRGGGKKLAGLVTGGVGVAMLATGVYFGLEAGTKATELENECASGCDFADPAIAAIDADGKAASRNAVILYSAGGVAVVTGVVLYMWGRSEAKAGAAQRVGFAPARGGGAVVTLTWTLD